MKFLYVGMLLIGICIFPCLSYANVTPEVEALAAELDKAQHRIDANSRQISLDIAEIESRISKLTGQITYANEASKNIDAKYMKIVEGLNSINNIWAKLKEVQVMQGKYEERLNSFGTDVVKLEKEIEASKNIVTWVTAIVSVVVILVGLFFSQRFLELYANYRVICSRLPKEDRERMGVN
ncbi:coiled-coil domain-containing protein [Marinobacter oulmenensis]|uniref:Peptidoglycan hydrolase CwlO-like protein n=1 Tax=Marinobacter oulmenensis TaxID=643747 RepID=A0A840UGQ1_9GAMM|nr:hypothetical protein [Marinobacter oulmenensis]MBB5321901.1 peptidoglycan hydrolase CwlO-like protein [Marinobacter oulmenensis]